MKFLKNKIVLYILSVILSFILVVFIEKCLYPSSMLNTKRAIFTFITSLLGLIYLINIFKIENKALKNVKDFCKNHTNIIKYSFSLILTIYASLFYHEVNFFLFGITELTLIYLLTNIIMKNHKKLGYVINDILILAFNANTLIIIFGGSYLSTMMLSNIKRIEDLRDKALLYIPASALVLFLSFLPHKYKEIKHRFNYISFTIIYQIILLIFLGSKFSPISNYGILSKQEVDKIRFNMLIKNTDKVKKDFYHKEVPDYITYENAVGEKPNVILIFNEGFSKHIMDDERNIMPHIKDYYENKTTSFENYYNHTAATYRGIIGQLYSGYQNDNLDENQLVSVMDILKNEGYETVFINVENENEMFSGYVKKLGFDKVLTYKSKDGITHDKEAYEKLYENAIKLNDSGKPFFLVIYTLDTHVSFKSSDKKFQKGDNDVLNRFYNVDYHFNKFMDKFNESVLYNNTILFFTTDHAAYRDADYAKTFDDVYFREHTFLDEIPLFIYHKDITVSKIDVDGRNSLDLAPTILDYLDYSGPNYFLGDTLFNYKSNSKYDTYFTEMTTFYTTKGNKISLIDKENEFKENLAKYFKISNPKNN